MTTIEITTENPAEMAALLNYIKRMEAGNFGNLTVHELRKEAVLHNVRPRPVQTGERLGGAQNKDQKDEAEKTVGKLIEDLRANADWLTEDMPVPADLKGNILKAARIIEIMYRTRDYRMAIEQTENEQICEARG